MSLTQVAAKVFKAFNINSDVTYDKLNAVAKSLPNLVPTSSFQPFKHNTKFGGLEVTLLVCSAGVLVYNAYANGKYPFDKGAFLLVFDPNAFNFEWKDLEHSFSVKALADAIEPMYSECWSKVYNSSHDLMDKRLCDMSPVMVGLLEKQPLSIDMQATAHFLYFDKCGHVPVETFMQPDIWYYLTTNNYEKSYELVLRLNTPAFIARFKNGTSSACAVLYELPDAECTMQNLVASLIELIDDSVEGDVRKALDEIRENKPVLH